MDMREEGPEGDSDPTSPLVELFFFDFANPVRCAEMVPASRLGSTPVDAMCAIPCVLSGCASCSQKEKPFEPSVEVAKAFSPNVRVFSDKDGVVLYPIGEHGLLVPGPRKDLASQDLDRLFGTRWATHMSQATHDTDDAEREIEIPAELFRPARPSGPLEKISENPQLHRFVQAAALEVGNCKGTGRYVLRVRKGSRWRGTHAHAGASVFVQASADALVGQYTTQSQKM